MAGGRRAHAVVIGSAPFYDHTRLESVLMPEATRGRVIYLYNFFVPKEFVMVKRPTLPATAAAATCT